MHRKNGLDKPWRQNWVGGNWLEDQAGGQEGRCRPVKHMQCHGVQGVLEGAMGPEHPPAPPSPCSPFPLALVQEGGGEAWGRTTGAKALFCFTAEMTLAGENEKMPCVLLQFEGRVTEEAAMVGLDGTTATKQTWSARAGRGSTTARALRASPRLARGGATKQDTTCFGSATLDNRQTLWGGGFLFQSNSPVWFRFYFGGQ